MTNSTTFKANTVVPRAAAGPIANDNTSATPAHDKDMARDFLTGLDPNASRFTFQFFGDGAGTYPKIVQGTLDEVWPKVQALNTPARCCGAFVTINETDFKGRRTENIMRARALFADADNAEQVQRCIKTFYECGAHPSRTVKSARGLHFYFFADDIPRDQFSELQKALANKVGTDPAVHDLPRVMRLPGTLHLKDTTNPRLVKLSRSKRSPCWKLADLVATLGLSQTAPAPASSRAQRLPATFTPAARERLQKAIGPLPVESLSDGLETNIEEIRSAVLAIPPSAISTELEWMRFTRGLAHEAAVHKDQAEQLWEILDTASRPAPEYDEEDNKRRWLRYIGEAFNRDKPITIATVFELANKHGWQGWSPPIVVASLPDLDSNPGQNKKTLLLSSAEFVAGFKPPDYLIDGLMQRKYVYSLTAPTGAGKTCIALRIALCVALGMKLAKMDVEKGRVLFFAGENPDDVRSRWIKLCEEMGQNPDDVDVFFMPGTPPISDPEIRQRINAEAARHGPFSLLIVDTSAAYFQGDDENSNKQLGDHARMMRSFTDLPGGPSVLVTCHPTKNPDMDNLLPRGGGAFLAEVDGNLVAIKQPGSMIVELNWHGKFRGPEFPPISFKIVSGTSDKLVDTKGRSVWTVTATPITETERDGIDTFARAERDDLLVEMYNFPGLSQSGYAEALNWRHANGDYNKRKVQTAITALMKDKLIEKKNGRYGLTLSGKKAVIAIPDKAGSGTQPDPSKLAADQAAAAERKREWAAKKNARGQENLKEWNRQMREEDRQLRVASKP
jgi:AAA domain/RepB DNA-primase from phage plasmid